MTLSAMKEATKMEILPADVVSRILESTPPYADDAQRDACEVRASRDDAVRDGASSTENVHLFTFCFLPLYHREW